MATENVKVEVEENVTEDDVLDVTLIPEKKSLWETTKEKVKKALPYVGCVIAGAGAALGAIVVAGARAEKDESLDVIPLEDNNFEDVNETEE